MKRIFILIYTLLFASAFLTQLTMFIIEHTALIQYRIQHMPLLVFSAFTPIIAIIELYICNVPKLPSGRLTEILKTEGYTPEFYKILKKWQEKCHRRGFGSHADIFMAGVLIDGGHYDEGFEILSAIEYENLTIEQKRSYSNTCLYGAILSGDREGIEEIFRRSKALLISSCGSEQTASIHNTLGCYEYICGNKKKAEYLFKRSLNRASSSELICDDLLALSACYADSGRLMQAKKAVEKAYDYALTVPTKSRVKRAMIMVEEAFCVGQKQR